MENPLREEIDEIAAEVRRNPTHIRRWLQKESALKKTPELFLKHRRFFTEDFVFEPDEEIMVYPDFPYPLPQPAPDEPPEFGEYPMHRHEFFELFYVYSGVCKCFYGDEVYKLRPGSLWIFNTQCFHNVENSENGMIFNIMVRRSAVNSELISMMRGNDLFMSFFLSSVHADGEAPAYMSFELNEGEAAEIFLFKIISEYHRGGSCSQELMMLMYASLLVELSRKYKSGAITADPSSLSVAKIISYISDRSAAITLGELAEKFHYSPAYISRLLLRHTGLNFSDYLRRFRLENAYRLIKHTELSTERIAELAGYSQRSSFEKEFKKYFGKTPCQTRKDS